MTSVQINFVKAGLKAGDSFEAIVFAEQQEDSYMNFLSSVISGTVAQISIDSIFEIKTEYSQDTDYVYIEHEAKSNEMTYYFTYDNEWTLAYPVGAFSIELDADTIGGFSNVDCAFVNEDDDPMSMIEAV